MTHDVSNDVDAASIVDLVSHYARLFESFDAADQSSRLAIDCCSVASLKRFNRLKSLLSTYYGVDSTD